MADTSTMDKNPFSYGVEFCEISIRRAFVRKVFFLVTIMLTICAVMCAFPFMIPEFGCWLTGNQPDNCYKYGYSDELSGGALALNITAMVVFIVIAITFACVPRLTRQYPLNLFLLAIFTLAAGAMLMCVSAWFTGTSVLLCMAITAASCGSVIIFAIFVPKDLTSLIGFMFLFFIWLFFFGITASISIWAFGVYWLNTVYSAIAAAFFLLWLAIDIQLVMGGRRFEISPEDYVFAALNIFLDIINIFLYILAIFGKFPKHQPGPSFPNKKVASASERFLDTTENQSNQKERQKLGRKTEELILIPLMELQTILLSKYSNQMGIPKVVTGGAVVSSCMRCSLDIFHFFRKLLRELIEKLLIGSRRWSSHQSNLLKLKLNQERNPPIRVEVKSIDDTSNVDDFSDADLRWRFGN